MCKYDSFRVDFDIFIGTDYNINDRKKRKDYLLHVKYVIDYFKSLACQRRALRNESKILEKYNLTFYIALYEYNYICKTCSLLIYV